LHATAKQRFEGKIPPGYLDLKDKDIPDAYGDCIGWLQLLEIARTEKKNVILVVDDFKEDWWQIERDRQVGPRPELLQEFCRTTGQRICIYTSENFLRAAKQFVAAEISDAVIKEVAERLADLRRSLRVADPKPTASGEDVLKASASTGATDDKPTGLKKPAADFAGGYTDKPDAPPNGGR
jgi:hypothetical protein